MDAGHDPPGVGAAPALTRPGRPDQSRPRPEVASTRSELSIAVTRPAGCTQLRGIGWRHGAAAHLRAAQRTFLRGIDVSSTMARACASRDVSDASGTAPQ